jgi:molecular chaperone GrpE
MGEKNGHDNQASIDESMIEDGCCGQEDSCQKECTGRCDDLQMELDVCKKKLTESQKLTSDWHNRYMLLHADFENFKKRTNKEFETVRTQEQMAIFEGIVSLVDDFDRALASSKEDKNNEDCSKLIDGLSLIRKSLEKVLADYGIEPMNNYVQFNPSYHEALVQVDGGAEHATGSIVSVLQPGYLMHGKVLRVAKVSVAQ